LSQSDLAEPDLVALKFVQRLAQQKGLHDYDLFQTVRLVTEYFLLRVDPSDYSKILALASSSSILSWKVSSVKALRDLEHLLSSDLSNAEIDVDSKFFTNARNLEETWQIYFEKVDAELPEYGQQASGETLSKIKFKNGYVAPQFLVAGLMSKFNEEWQPILRAYRKALKEDPTKLGPFASLQASQWLTWLTWGPSIPICTCSHWDGHYALQFGHGDEDNSVPLMEQDDRLHHANVWPTLEKKLAETRGAMGVSLTGSLGWGPDLYSVTDGVEADEDDDQIGQLYLPRQLQSKLRLASAQSTWLSGEAKASKNQSDGLLVRLKSFRQINDLSYFTAYQWMMFLVARANSDSEAGPTLLNDAKYCSSDDVAIFREKLKRSQLWNSLIPVFTHANIADHEALNGQRAMLVGSAISMLRELMSGHKKYFTGTDWHSGLKVYLVSSSDYSGCGSQIRFKQPDSLGQLLLIELAKPENVELANFVVVPDQDAVESERPLGLAENFSSCHLPDLVAAYFAHVKEINDRQNKRKATN
jgi:hypothetical protein